MGWIAHDNATLVTLGDTASFTHESGELWAMIGLISIAVMMARGIKGAIIFGVLGASVAGWALSVNDPYNESYPVIVFCIEPWQLTTAWQRVSSLRALQVHTLPSGQPRFSNSWECLPRRSATPFRSTIPRDRSSRCHDRRRRLC